jgi:hypothetical protein
VSVPQPLSAPFLVYPDNQKYTFAFAEWVERNHFFSRYEEITLFFCSPEIMLVVYARYVRDVCRDVLPLVQLRLSVLQILIN